MKTIEILKKLKTDSFVLHSTIPMGYAPGLPMIALRNGEPCLIIPYLKYLMTGKVDNTRIFPPKYVVTVAMSDGVIVKYEDLMFDTRFEEVDFKKPVGFFRHSAISHLSKVKYSEMRSEIYQLIDRLGESMSGKIDFDEIDERRFCKLYSILLEPSAKPFYHAIDKMFYETYINKY